MYQYILLLLKKSKDIEQFWCNSFTLYDKWKKYSFIIKKNRRSKNIYDVYDLKDDNENQPRYVQDNISSNIGNNYNNNIVLELEKTKINKNHNSTLTKEYHLYGYFQKKEKKNINYTMQ